MNPSFTALLHEKDLEEIGHQEIFFRVVNLFRKDKDFLVIGVPGSGRNRLMNRAARGAKAIPIEIDCIRVANSLSFVDFLLMGIYKAFGDANNDSHSELLGAFNKQLVDWCDADNLFVWPKNDAATSSPKLQSHVEETSVQKAFKDLTQLLDKLANQYEVRVVILLKQISHIRTWDRTLKWEELLKSQINSFPEVSYVILETVSELREMTKKSKKQPLEHEKKKVGDLYDALPVDIVQLKPINDAEVISHWVWSILESIEIKVDADAIRVFVDSVEGHIGSAETLLRRLIHDCSAGRKSFDKECIQEAKSILLDDLSITFESLLFVLPASQLQLIECLAVEPTSKPHSKQYIEKYNLARGGQLQSALVGLQQKGLIYGAEDNFQLTLPLFAAWIRRRIGVQDKSS